MVFKEDKILIIFILALVLCLVIGWILYALVGHYLIKAMYEGRSIGFLNRIIEGQALYPLGHYFKEADRLFFTLNFIILFFCIIVFLGFLRYLKQSTIKYLISIIVVFILSRVFFFHMGIRFDTSSLVCFCQHIDPDLLKNNLFQSIYYLHSQPPLFNLFLGSILKLFPQSYMQIFNLIYLAFGLMLSVSIFLIMVRLRVSNKLSAILTILFMVSPASILYENWLFRTYPLAALLCLSALFLHRFSSYGKLRDGIAFFILLSLIILTGSSFHILWFLLFIFMLIFFEKHNWKKIIFVSFIPFIIVIFLYAKNLYLFGTFSSSSWLGMHFSKTTTFALSEDERKLLVNQGKISKLALIEPFSNLLEYKNFLPIVQKTNIPVLDQQITSTGCNNFNNIAYIDISKQYLKDALYILVSHPKAYLKALMGSYDCYFTPSTEYSFLNVNRNYIKYLDRLYNMVFCGQFLCDVDPNLKKHSIMEYYAKKFLSKSLFLMIGFVILVFYSFYLVSNALFKKPIDLPFALTVLFLWINIIYVTLVSNSMEVGENQRFRFSIDPFLLILLGLFINHIFIKYKTIHYANQRGNTGFFRNPNQEF